MNRYDIPFFVGYLKPPKKLRKMLLATSVLLVGFMMAAGLLIGATQGTDPDGGAYRFDYGPQTVTGVVELLPYPLLHVTKGNDRLKPGRTLMLTNPGKQGASHRLQSLADNEVTVTGVILQRGTLDMLQLAGRQNGVKPAEGGAPAIAPAPTDLGRWKLTGEICDGKCLSGAMRPGRGIAHKACANLCLIGDVPPVFVSTQPVEGSEFLMILGPNGGPLPNRAYDAIGQYISLEGGIERHGEMLVLKMDTDTIEVVE